MTPPRLGSRFRDALQYAALIHHDQCRKGGTVPYIGHLLGVAAIVIEEGGSEDEAIAALLHDVVEDQREREKELRIAHLFGPKVDALVRECSDLDEHGGRTGTSAERKARYVAHIPHKSAGALLISLADKLYNARSILLDLERPGIEPDEVFERFNIGKAGTLKYYSDLVEAFRVANKLGRHHALAKELAKTVERIKQLAS